MSFETIPIWAVFLLTAAVIAAALEVGYRLGRWRIRRGGNKSDVSGAMVGSAMGLLAFMLAFTFNAAASRHDARKSLVIEDTNAIEKTWLRAGFLAESQRTEVRQILRGYVDLRVKVAAEEVDVPAALAQFDALHGRLWAIASDVAQREPGSIMAGLFVEALNEMIDLQLKRVTVGVRNRVPPTIWLALYLLTGVGMLMMGVQVGLGGARQAGIEVALALSFSIVLFLIADLDRPQQGLVNVSQQAMTELQAKLNRH